MTKLLLSIHTLTHAARRIAGDDVVGLDVVGHDAPCGDDGPTADAHSRQDDGPVADPDIRADDDLEATPGPR